MMLLMMMTMMRMTMMMMLVSMMMMAMMMGIQDLAHIYINSLIGNWPLLGLACSHLY